MYLFIYFYFCSIILYYIIVLYYYYIFYYILFFITHQITYSNRFFFAKNIWYILPDIYTFFKKILPFINFLNVQICVFFSLQLWIQYSAFLKYFLILLFLIYVISFRINIKTMKNMVNIILSISFHSIFLPFFRFLFIVYFFHCFIKDSYVSYLIIFLY